MAEKNLALSLLINAKDQSAGVLSSIKRNITSLAAGFIGLFSVALFKRSIDDAELLDTQMRKLEATIKATGGAAGLTAADIAAMFNRDDNAADFRDAAAQLLTFKSVSKDVFETTLRLADDLADAGFGNLQTNAVQLGKALEDPVKGLTALTRSGVTFSESEQLLIKQLVETGDKAKAQGIILQAVAGQVGGVADAVGSGLRGANESLDASFRQIRESIGGLVIPILTEYKTVLADNIAKLAEFINSNKSVSTQIQSLYSAVKSTAVVVADVIGIRLVNSLIKSSQEFVKNALAAREAAAAQKLKSIADKEQLTLALQLSAVRVKTAQTMLVEAQQQKALAVTGAELAVATKKVAAAMVELKAAQAGYAVSSKAVESAMTGMAAKASFAEKSVLALNNAFAVFLAYDIGKSIGEWLNQFDAVRKAGTYVAETFVQIKSDAENLINGASFEKMLADNARIAQEFDDIRKASAETIPQEEKRAEAIEGTTAAIATQNAEVETVINQFKIWDKTSTDTVDNIAAELKKLSDVELANLKTTLADAFETGTNRSAELQRALEQINTEEVSRAWKTLGQESSASLKQSADAARAAYTTIRDSGTASAKDLENAWSAYINKVLQTKAAISEVDAAEKQRKQNLADLDAIGSTAADQSELRRRELTQKTIDFEKALRQGDFAEAVRLGQEKEALALENARAEKQAFADGEKSSSDAYLARQQYLRSIEDTKKALGELGQAEQQQTDGADGQQPPQNTVANQQAEAAKLQQTLDLLKQPINLQINSNFAAQIGLIDQLQQKANALNATLANGGTTTAANDGQAAVSNGLGTEVLKRGARI